MKLIGATETDLESIKELLLHSNLMVDDIEKHLTSCFVFKEQERLIAFGAIELYGIDALLRSVAVAQTHRKKGLGEKLYHAIQEMAKVNGVRELFLLTETAEGFFQKMGFERLSRDNAPESIRQTSQFSSLCPDSAVFMKRSI